MKIFRPSTEATARPRPALFRALGRSEPPHEVTVDGSTYTRVEIYKHDSWAATARYSDGHRQLVCKFNRQQSVLGLPMRWLGRWLARHEMAVLMRLRGLNRVPALAGTVRVDGRCQPNALARWYIPGTPLRAGMKLEPHFFSELNRTLAALHERNVAYVDLHKRENVIVGLDGMPYLIDFQVSFLLPRPRWPQWSPLTSLLRMLQRGDRYHARKHNLKFNASAEQRREMLAHERPWWIRTHRWLAVPFRELRRRLLVLLGIRRGRGRVETEQFVEDGLRAPAPPPSRRAA